MVFFLEIVVQEHTAPYIRTLCELNHAGLSQFFEFLVLICFDFKNRSETAWKTGCNNFCDFTKSHAVKLHNFQRPIIRYSIVVKYPLVRPLNYNMTKLRFIFYKQFFQSSS